MSNTHIAYACAAEANVGYLTAYAVLFKGKEVRSTATYRVAAWAKQNGISLRKSGENEQQANKRREDDVLTALEKKFSISYEQPPGQTGERSGS